MAGFQLAVLDTAVVTDEVIAMLELSAFFRGEADLTDLPLDRDLACYAYIASLSDEDLKTDYLAEPGIPEGLMMEDFRSEAADALGDRVRELAEHYPFCQDAPGLLVRKTFAEITLVGASYMALQFYRALHANSIEVVGENSKIIEGDKKQFGRDFANLFECIAGYAVAGRNTGTPYMTSASRSAQKFHKLLSHFCTRLGAGRVKNIESFSEEMKNTNDGKVDCLVHVGDLPVNGATRVYLVGASLQKQAPDQKIMGSEKISFVSDFFDKKPATFHGILVRPQDEDDLTLDKCTRRNCLLYSYDVIWRNMGKRDGSRYQSRALRRLDRSTKQLLQNFQAAVYHDDFEEFGLNAT